MQTIKLLLCSAAVLMIAFATSCKGKGGLHYEAIHSASGWGYDISANNRILIHQQSIPGRPANSGFQTKYQAENMAKIVMQKMGNGAFPSVTEEEINAVEQMTSNE